MINLMITFYSLVNGIDPSLAFQMARVERNMNSYAVSKTNDGGLFQLNRTYYKFHNPSWIFNPNINIALALNKLSKLKKECKHTTNNSFILCYNMGTYGAGKIKKPFLQTYYKKMNLLWRSK